MASEEYLDKGVYSRRRLCQRVTDDKNLNFNIRNQYTTYGEKEKRFFLKIDVCRQLSRLSPKCRVN